MADVVVFLPPNTAARTPEEKEAVRLLRQAVRTLPGGYLHLVGLLTFDMILALGRAEAASALELGSFAAKQGPEHPSRSEPAT